MTNEQLAADYTKPAFLSNVMLAAAITDEDIETYIKFSYTNGGTVWREVLEEAARRLTHKLRCASGIAEVVRRDDVERRIWTHYDHAREKHPYFCDWLRPVHLNLPAPSEMLIKLRGLIDRDSECGMLCWETLVSCENWEVINAIEQEDYAAAVEECYDAIAVLLRVIDVLEGRQKLGKPEKGAAE